MKILTLCVSFKLGCVSTNTDEKVKLFWPTYQVKTFFERSSKEAEAA